MASYQGGGAASGGGFSHSFSAGNAPSQADLAALAKRAKLKQKYLELQRNYTRALQMRKDLTLELEEKEAKIQRLQDEVDLVVDQVYATDYAHLAPKTDDLFSDSGEDEEDAPRPNGSHQAKDNGTTGGEGDGGPSRNGNGTAEGRVRRERSYSTGDSEEDRKPKKARLEEAYASTTATMNGHATPL